MATLPVSPPASAQHTLRDLFEYFTVDYLPDKAASTRYFYKCLFAWILKDLGNVPLAELTPDLLRSWKVALSQDHKPATVRKYMSRFDTALCVCVEQYGWLATNPLAKGRTPAPGRGRVRFLTTDERQRLLAACLTSRNPMLYAIVVVALNTGGRKNEIRKLQWHNVDLEQGVVRFVETKTRESWAVPLVGEARTVLSALAARRTPGVSWVFPDWSGRRPCYVDTSWYTALQHCGLHDFRFHDLRHTFASYMAMSGSSLREIAEVLGHKSITMTMIYTHLLPSHTAGVAQRRAEQFLDAPVAAPVEVPPPLPVPVAPSLSPPTAPLSLAMQVFETVRALAPMAVSAFQVAKTLHIPQPRARDLLQDLTHQGVLTRMSKGYYRVQVGTPPPVPPHDGKGTP